MKREITPEGIEKSFATNYLGPFTLTNELLPILKKTAPSRIINISSGIHQIGKIEFQDLQNEKNYRGMNAYANSKLLLTTHTYELADSIQGTGVTANILEPGFVTTNLGKNSGSLFLKLMFAIAKPLQIPPAEAAKLITWAALSPELQKATGKCFAKQEEIKTANVSYDKEIQKLLKQKTEELLKRHTY
jgi:NAD(P)-dependent dehydrogenase (short-subunit alcohol dehydrogenase family)